MRPDPSLQERKYNLLSSLAYTNENWNKVVNDSDHKRKNVKSVVGLRV